MKMETRTAAVLLATLVLGALLGAAGGAALAAERRGRIAELRRPGGFAEHMEEVIRPRDDAQRALIRPAIEETDARNQEIVRAANAALRARLDTLRARLAPHLDADQRARLDRFARMAPPLGHRPPPPGGGRPGGGPPPGAPPGGPPPR